MYYVKAETLISDQEYDRLERDLRKLVTEFPEEAIKAAFSLMCPVTSVGSSSADDYPRLIEQIAESLLKFDKELKKRDV